MKTVKKIFILVFVILGLLMAEADGPDFYRVKGVAQNDVLNIRNAPNPDAIKIGEIPPGANCIKNLGCKGGLTMEEFTTLSKNEQKEILKKRPRWCQVVYGGIKGWVSSHYLEEESCN